MEIVTHVTCDRDKKDAHGLCDSEYTRMAMPNNTKHKIFEKYIFWHDFEKKIKKIWKIHVIRSLQESQCQM